jgi:TldD protein
MDRFAKEAISIAVGLPGVTYADVRVSITTTQTIFQENLEAPDVDEDTAVGFGIRILARGGWGFAATPKHPSKRSVEVAVHNAYANAIASAKTLKKPIVLVAERPHVARWTSPFVKDPFKISLSEKARVLYEASKIALKVKGIQLTTAGFEFTKTRKLFMSSEGAHIVQDFTTSACGMDAWAFYGDNYQVRSYPNSSGGQYEQGGWEVIEKWALADNAERMAEEAVAVSRAPLCPEFSEGIDIVIGGSQMALQTHESCMHPCESDRAYGEEENYAGQTFMLPDNLGRMKYGSSLVNITANSRIPGGLGSFKYDDEGVLGQRTPLIQEGLFVGYLTSRETAAKLGLSRSGGSMRSETGSDIPMIRGTNVSLEPGNAGSLDSLISGVKHGIYFDTNQSWSIDDRRHNFQFGTEIAWEIRRGKLHRVLRDASYSGITQKFWNSCKAICSQKERVIWGIPNCGKGQPCQGMKVGHGAQPALFHKVQVGVATKDAMAHSTGGGCAAHKKGRSRHQGMSLLRRRLGGRHAH